MATLRGETVDRPAVSFYELNGLDEDPDDADPYNIYNDPSCAPLLSLTREHTDRIVMRGLRLTGGARAGHAGRRAHHDRTRQQPL